MGISEFYVARFYKVVALDNYYDMKSDLLEKCKSLGIKGTIILSCEGINSTVCAASMEALDEMFAFLGRDERLAGIHAHGITRCEYEPFLKMVVRLKLGVVNIGIPYPANEDCAGLKVNAEEWDEWISRDDVGVIDVRNDYEGDCGTFKNAIIPDTRSFSEFISWFDKVEHTLPKTLAICCTGGIRCEKAGPYLIARGYNIVNLKGGILSYLEQKNGKQGLWSGECFVFDDRVVVNSGLNPNPRCAVCDGVPDLDDLRRTSRGKVACSNCYVGAHHQKSDGEGCEACDKEGAVT